MKNSREDLKNNKGSNRKLEVHLILILFGLFCSFSGVAQTDLWWTGANNNNWSEGPNWSTTDPALGPATPAVSAPSGAVDVHFNDGSFPNAVAYTILVDSDVNCKSLLFEGDGNATSIILNGGGELSVFGNLIFLPEAPGSVLDVNLGNRIKMTGTSTGNLVDFKNQSTPADLEFDGLGASWIFQSPARIFDDIILTNGTVDFNSQTILVDRLVSNSGTAGRNIIFGDAIFNFRNGAGVVLTGEFATLSGNPEFLFDSVATGQGFIRMGTSGATPTLSIKKVRSSNIISLWLNEENDAFFEDIETSGLQVRNSSPVDIGNLALKYGNGSIRIGPTGGGESTARIDNLTITGDPCLTHSFNTLNLDFATRPTLERLSLLNSDALINGVAASPAITITDSFDNGNNKYWDIQSPLTKNYYWIGNSGDWNTITNWSNTSGGTPLDPLLDCLPSQADDVFFDANSFNADGQALNIDNAQAAICRNMLWQGLDQINIDWTGTSPIQLWGDLTLDKNMVEDISYDQFMYLRDPVEGLFDFQSGADNRNMPNVLLFWPDNNVTYRQLSDEVYIGYVRSMGNSNFRTYNIGGNQNNFRTRLGFRDGGRLIMNNANVYNEGSGTAITGAGINIISDANSHWYSTNPGTITHFRGSSLFPDFTQTEPTATMRFVQSNFISTGDAVFNGSFDGATSTNGATATSVTGKLTLAAGKTHQFLGGVTAGEIEAKGTSCGDGPVIRSKTGAQINLNVPQGNADFQFATLSDLNYIGDTNPLNLDGQEATDAGNTNNIDFGGIVSHVYYWRPNPDDNSYSGNWNNPKYWALNKADTNGQATALGCVPKAQDSVVFDNQSGNGSLVNVLVDDSQGVKSMTWVNTGADAIPANMNFEVASTGVLDIKANLNLADAMTTAWEGATNFNGADTTRIDTRGKNIGGLVSFQNGVSILQSDWNGDAQMTLDSGELNTNENDLSINSFFSTTTDSRKLIIKNSTITITGVDLSIAGSNASPRTSWMIQNAQTAPLLEFDGENSVITITGLVGENNFYGDGLTYNSVNINPSDGNTGRVINLRGENTFLENLNVVGTGNFIDSFTVNKLNLSTDVNHEFTSGNTTTFLEQGNLEKNGDLAKFLNLNSSTNGSLHNFVKATGGNIFICNLNIVDVQATGVPFKTNDVSTYNGLAGAAAAPPAGTTWDFTAASTPATIALTDAADKHINLGDDALVNYEITGNDTGPYRATIDVLGVSEQREVLSAGDPTTGIFELELSATDDIEVTNFEYFDCPGSFKVGSGIGDITPVKIPSVAGKSLAADGATETYPFNNKQGYIYVMDGADRSALANFEMRLPQVAIQDGLNDADTDSLGDVTVSTTIDGTNIDNNPFVYLTRRWNITNTAADTGANVRFYLDQTELTALKIAANKTAVPDLDFLQSLSLFKTADGTTPGVGVDQVQQMRIAARLAPEISGSTYVYEAFIENITGSYALGTSISPGGVASSIKLWIKASKDVSETAGEVTSWLDQSGASVDFTNTGLATGIVSGPTYNATTNLYNYNPTVSFDGTQGLYEATKSALDANNVYTIWMIVEGTPSGVVWSQEADLPLPAAGTNPSITADGQTDQLNTTAAGGANNTLTGGLDVSEPALIVASRGDTGGFNWTLLNYRNGTQVNTASFTGELETVLDAMSLGYRHKTDGTSENPFTGSLAEMIVYGQVLTEADNIKVATYLAQKHGITLSHDYVASNDVTLFDTDGGDSTYANDIAGIGRDDQSCQDQRQSKSNNTDAIVAMAQGSLAATNAANTNAFTNDQEHLYWGNDNGAANWIAAGAPQNYQVLERTWKAREVGSVGAVNVTFDVADADFDVPLLLDGSAYFIIVDTDMDGDLSDETPTALSNSSGDLWEANIDFANNAIFSIATLFVDTDLDGVVNSQDIDDDNDGILDTVEAGNTDTDGIPDRLDLDSDNDGIPDNVEAQETGNYIAPSTTSSAEYLTNNGVNNAYLTTNGGGPGLDPVDTDANATEDLPDYLDTDADDDTVLDSAENGDTDNTIVTFADDDGDGMDNLFDTVDNATNWDVNDKVTLGDIADLQVSFGDFDNDAAPTPTPLDSDLSFRDNCQIIAGIIASDRQVCTTDDPTAFTINTPTRIDAGTITYQWQSSTTSATAMDFVNISGATSATYDSPTVTQDTWFKRIDTNTLNGNSCSLETNVIALTVKTPPEAGTTTDFTICEGETVTLAQLNASLTGADMGGTWSPTLAGAGVYTYTVTATSPCTVDDTATVTVSEQAQPEAGTTTDFSICEGETVTLAQLNASLTGADAGGTWSPALAGAGVYTYTVTATSPCTVDDTVTVTVSEQALPEAGTTTDFSICEGETVTLAQLNASLTGADTGGTWSPALAGAGVYTYTVTATSPCTVDDTVTVTVSEQALPEAGTTTDFSICEGETVTLAQLNASLTGADTGGTWSPALAGAGVYTYTVAATSPCTVDDTVTVTVSEQTLPEAGTTTDFSICEGETVTLAQLNASLTGADTGGTWSPALAGAGVYTYTVAATSPCTVDDTVTVTVSEQTLPEAGTTTDFSICEGETVTLAQLNASLTGADTGGTWSPALAGAGVYTYTVAATAPCVVDDTVTVTVTSSNLTPGVIGADQTIFTGDDPAAFTETTAATGLGTLGYQWQSTTSSATATDFTDIPGATNAIYDSGPITQDTWFRRIVTSTTGSSSCTAISNVLHIEVNTDNTPPTVDSFTTENTTPTLTGTGEPNEDLMVEVDTDGDAITDVVYMVAVNGNGIWSIDPDTITPASGSFPTLVDGDSITVSAIDAAGNMGVGTIDITIDMDTDGDGIFDNQEAADGTDPLDDCDSVNGTPSPNGDCDGDGITNIDEDINTNRNLYDDDCDNDGIPNFKDADTCGVIVSTLFTPNGDGINDTWVIKGIENYPNSHVKIYNRWSHQIFEAKNYQNNWGGYYKDNIRKLPPASYFYVISLENGSAPINGWIFLNY